MKKIVPLICGLLIVSAAGWGDIQSLSSIFLPGQALMDMDGDGFVDSILLKIYLPENPSPQQAAAAADMAARANFESLTVDFSLVKSLTQLKNPADLQNAILINPNNEWMRDQLKISLPFEKLGNTQGSVTFHSQKGVSFVVVRGGSDESLLKTSRAFFLRWPYLWEIWGREEGITYSTMEKDLAEFLESQELRDIKIIISGAHYEFREIKSPHDTIKRLLFDGGEINSLDVHLVCPDRQKAQLAGEALAALGRRHKMGQDTRILSYPGTGEIHFQIKGPEGGEGLRVTLRRMGYPKRMLTASYKPVRKPRIAPDSFDLVSLFTLKGLYGDSDADGIPDSIKTSIILPEEGSGARVWEIASRLVLHTAGASFPLVKLDTEVEKPETLQSPILIGGRNALVLDLIKKGKIPEPALPPGSGEILLIPEALNKSAALVIRGGDPAGLLDTSAWFSRTFPYVRDYRSGAPDLSLLSDAVSEFLEGKRGSAEAFFIEKLNLTFKDWENKEFDSMKAEIFLPEKNSRFAQYVEGMLKKAFPIQALEVKVTELEESDLVFEKEKEFQWEADEAVSRVKEALLQDKAGDRAAVIHMGISESPQVRKKIKEDLERFCSSEGIALESIEVLSAYKQGFFWLTERVIPRLKDLPVGKITVKYAGVMEDHTEPKRFYSEPYRWLQELYPVDEIFNRDLGIPLENIVFEWKDEQAPVYEAVVEDEAGKEIFRDSFTPRTRQAPYLEVIPEWGGVTITTGWATASSGKKILLDTDVRTDLERFWAFYQKELLPEVHEFILKKTGRKPSFSKQPYFKRFMVEMWFSEPDFRLGLDEEIISSLESMHDEFYFDTLDFLRGITRVEIDDDEVKEDTSRYSAPGNVLPLIHASSEGAPGRIKAVFEDWKARSPQMILSWTEKGGHQDQETIKFSPVKAKNVGLVSLVYDGRNKRLADAVIQADFEKEEEYVKLINIIHTLRDLHIQDRTPEFITLPGLAGLTLHLKHKDLLKEEALPVKSAEKPDAASPHGKPGEPMVPSDEIISYEKCLEIVDHLGKSDTLKAYIAGESYEKRKVPVLEAFTPMNPYTSLERLVTFKPTLYLSGRQHANEISSTSYILKFAEKLAADVSFRNQLKKMNIVMHPMENPDGAALAFRLQEITPFHSLHAGRYTALGIDVGYQVGSSRPLLPEARVRRRLMERWKPDIHLNLHGYPSHEWVQQFSDYSPYLFRDYWIPRGWFVYFRSLSLPIYETWQRESKILKDTLIRDMNADREIRDSNRRHYDRYYRWASRWQPHMDYLELYDGLNVYAKRRSGRESTLTPRSKITFVEQTPELMDETARGEWLSFLTEQGLTYIMAHIKYLSRLKPRIVRIDEGGSDSVTFRFIRSRPGDSPSSSDRIVKAPTN